ncbi:formylglycine-generating enzyme required for sulfatase activity [Lutibacter sp. Hel_I_33_5]|uniref:formylglycine-generating enzyme family protein n=1 Tax=Lutibacter sp. Hel_I_33_5 TaxID=1566289 RepID=UPI00119C9121|nr:formylglycine-generating enzyme family protein [Lutibacter sp. Hel_I_33_5]TVZ55847.1 formylglycine-generating enzyme required for sulfatase activity [Lutibacter sp. Hel_I_33_5]
MIKKYYFIKLVFFCIVAISFSCKKNSKEKETIKDKEISKINPPKGMVWVERKTFIQGAKKSDTYAMEREKPAHKVTVDGFFIDITEVTNKQYKKFVEATNYITIAERVIDWEEMKKQLPSNAQKPHDSILQPGSLIFNKDVNAVVSMQNYSQWWTWKIGANWKHPEGPNSNLVGKDNFPVVHIAYEDALAYCKWANRRLPTEAEWESAAQGSNNNAIFTWGNESEKLDANANTWQGVFPVKNESVDGFEFISPVKSYPPNSIGLYDIAGNVWEVTSDLFNVNYYKEIDIAKPLLNPKGANKYYNPNNPYQVEYIMKGGSFLCHASYCSSFRISAKMGVVADSASDHMGFRTVATPDMLTSK